MTLRPLDYDTQTGFSAGLTHALIQALDPEKLLHRNCTVHTCKSHPKCSVSMSFPIAAFHITIPDHYLFAFESSTPETPPTFRQAAIS